MRTHLATLLMLTAQSLSAYTIEANASYDYFRGAPDGSWNGNTGAFLALNANLDLFNCAAVQAGGSYGLYNWDGRGNLTFTNPKSTQQVAFVTAGVTASFQDINVGVVYDRLFSRHFGIYNLDPTFDQIRFQAGYNFTCDELGVWGTANLTTSHKYALGIPTDFRAISQINLFWSHLFETCAKTTLFVGLPYKDSLMYPHKRQGNFTAGFSIRAPLTRHLLVDGYGSYMQAASHHGVAESRNYAACLTLGITYFFGGVTPTCSSYMPIANHSNFLVDTNINQ